LHALKIFVDEERILFKFPIIFFRVFSVSTAVKPLQKTKTKTNKVRLPPSRENLISLFGTTEVLSPIYTHIPTSRISMKEIRWITLYISVMCLLFIL